MYFLLVYGLWYTLCNEKRNMNINVKYEDIVDFINQNEGFIYKLIATSAQGITSKLTMKIITVIDQYYLVASTKDSKSVVLKLNLKETTIDDKKAIFTVEVETDGLIITLVMKFVKEEECNITFSHDIDQIIATKMSMKATIPIINMTKKTMLRKVTARINKKVEWILINEQLNGNIINVSKEQLKNIQKARIVDFIKELS